MQFSEPTRAWFAGAFAAPTPAQEGAWDAIASGEHALVVAPTGSGKTLAAFLWAVDQMLTAPLPPDAERCRVLYVSPLKALAADVERNLRSPLVGITRAADRLGTPVPGLRVGVRTGDTPASERRRLAAHPPDILITTPESLYLVLTSAARAGLRGVGTVIVDEIHALAGTKRGAHLALSLERLDALLPAPAQRVGLSATVRPVPAVASYLAGQRPVADGGRPVRVVEPAAAKDLAIDVVVPVADLTDPAATPLPRRGPAAGPDLPADDAGANGAGPDGVGADGAGDGAGAGPDGAAGPDLAASPDLSGDAAGAPPDQRGPSVWPHVTERVVDLLAAHRSTLVFTNSRRAAERLTARINEAFAARQGGAVAVLDDGAAWPAQAPGQSGTALPAEAVARAHHGSMSREERVRTESALKSGQLRAVVATSSLELGIDMGAVDLVVQVGAPPSVASTLQRVGRAGHQVGARSHGVVLPTYRGELLPATVTAERSRAGLIEEVRVPANPLDVLAQQVVAMLAMEDLAVADLAALVRRATPFAGLGERSLTAVLDMLAGRYPSEDFAELRPRIVWDRGAGTLRARPGALRLAVTSGGTIPDRGLYGVYLAGGEDAAVTAGARGAGRRVGELDEEMVYESRVGDTFTLGTSTWRIEEITPDRVLVSPAPGQPGRLPFWKGDSPGRPAELGRALGATTRELAAHLDDGGAAARLAGAGLDGWATDNAVAYLTEQRAATGYLPDDNTLVVERFRDELGDWRLVLHSPYGARVHAPWAMVLAARLGEATGMDVNAAPSDDGIVLRLPGTDTEGAPVEAADLLLDPGDVTGAVAAALTGSAHFAARFREAAARALLLPRRRPDRRQPLWQQRHRAAQLLGVAAQHQDFPIVLEAVRECLQDDFDVPALTDLMRRVAAREVAVVEVATQAPSPFARSLLMGYVAQFLYDGDAPLAERRAAALTLDPAMLAELVGTDLGDLADLLDPAAVAEVAEEVGLRTPASRARDAEGLVDLVRRLGPLPAADLAARASDPAAVGSWLADLAAQRRVMAVRVAGTEQWAVVEDAARLRDALGTALPVGLPEAVLAPVPDPLADLVRRHARTHGPFRPADVAARFGLAPGAVQAVLAALVHAGALVQGRLTPDDGGPQLCDAEVLRRVRRRSLAHLRREVEPVPARTLGVFTPRWQHVAPVGARPDLRGPDGVLTVVDQLAGALVPASALESLLLPARVAGYQPGLLDELTSSGEVVWVGGGALPGVDGVLTLLPADAVAELAPLPDAAAVRSGLHRHLLGALAGGGRFFRELVPDGGPGDVGGGTPPAPGDAGDAPAGPADVEQVLQALWDLVWAGWVTNDTLAPVRARLGGGRPTHATRPAAARPRSTRPGAGLRRAALSRPALAGARPRAAVNLPAAVGRWSLVRPGLDPAAAAALAADTEARTQRVTAATAALLERHGVLVRGAAGLEDLPGGFGAAYQVLRRLEESGQVRRGYLVEGLGGAQFALPEVVDRLRADAAALSARGPVDDGAEIGAAGPAGGSADLDDGTWSPDGWPDGAGPSPGPAGPGGARYPAPGAAPHSPGGPRVDLLAATDPANAYGAALGWPPAVAGEGHRPGRKAGAVVVLVDGALVLYVERGGRTLLSFTRAESLLAPAAAALATVAASGALGPLTVRRIDGAPALDSADPLGGVLRAAGFGPTPRGLRLRAAPVGARGSIAP
ncbi:DEAD/DEAH box helicase [Georgenia sp. TF02-10]|uniref:DEAD/DEAH box helicase n=1 Tax=Georgenia sp. TF02-10 TaxID=2917725 RepID=UPI001FA81356|nr:DEAD/DEAH box helicase [Georgenia sp. TF02-10]UNX55939.1 DEAD/DEAH box helicase [Georgenia sp. TF02-10]